jgi:hypothetical protein
MGKIINGKNTPLTLRTGTVPDVSGALKDKFQLVAFKNISKSVEAFQNVDTETVVQFWGTWEPFTDRQLLLKPEGQRSWSWYMMIAEPGAVLETDDIAEWNGKPTRVMALKDWSLHGFMEYHLVQNWQDGL